jgi:hypothetical protein
MVERLDGDEDGNPSPTASGFTRATVASITPSARRRWMRRQQGVCDRPTRAATSATASDASSWRMARILRSTRSSFRIVRI